MTPKNIALEPELFERVGKLAEEQGKTADELMNETAVRLLEAQKDVGDLRAFVARNRANAEAMGLKESDVPRLIAESRAERRR
jgi:hypothetical protein